MGLLSYIIRDNKFTPADVPKFEAKLFFEGARKRPYRERFGVLLFLATLIATMGVMGQSTATVIGAMIVAPLMTPIMATTAALLTGQTARAVRSTVLVVVGVVGVIAVSWLFGSLEVLSVGRILSFETNPQITGRISPTSVDFIAALAAGAAGAFAMSRDDIADSLAGVAISIALVPPLCVVGIALAAGEWPAAAGALLLFMTNYLSILLAGGGVLAFLGLPQAATVGDTGAARRNAYIIIAVTALIASVPLALTGDRLAEQSIEQIQAETIVKAWIDGTNYELRNLELGFGSEQIGISISGAGDPPLLGDLGPQLEEMLQDDTVQIKLDIVPADRRYYPETGSEDRSAD